MGKHQNALKTPSATRESMEAEIRSLAYRLHCEGGYRDGRNLEHWLEAEPRVMVRRNTHLRKVV
jgi:hypothetical protein